MIREQLIETWRTLVPSRDDPFGPLTPMMVILTLVTGLVDAFSYLGLGHVFVANMTGNVVFLGFALAGAKGFSVAASLTAYAAFGLGSIIGGQLAGALKGHRGRLLSAATSIQFMLVAIAVGLSSTGGLPVGTGYRYGLIVVLAVTMGIQNAAARKLAVPDMTTTVLTLTTTGIFSDARFLGGPGAKLGRRFLSIAAMFVGALVGAILVVHNARTIALVIALALVALVALASGLLSLQTPKWAEA